MDKYKIDWKRQLHLFPKPQKSRLVEKRHLKTDKSKPRSQHEKLSEMELIYGKLPIFTEK